MPPEPHAPRRVVLGTAALTVVSVLRYVLQLAILPVLARLLDPESFGVVALAIPFVLFANVLADGGMGTALVRQQNPTRELESTVFWLSCASGVVFTSLALIFAHPLSLAFGHTLFAPIFMALSPIMLIGAALAAPNSRIVRAQRFEMFAIGDVISALLSAGVGIGAAIAGFGAWSLVLGQLSLWLAKAAWVGAVSGFRPLLYCRPSLAKPLIRFGLHSVGANAADFASKNLAPLVIGSLLGAAAVGHYAMGWQLVRIPEIALSGPIALAVFTGVANAKTLDRDLVLRPLRLMFVALAPLFAGLALVADLAVPLLFGDQWHETAPTISALAPAGLLLCLYAVAGSGLLGAGRADRQFQLTLATGVAILLGVTVGSRFGIVGAAAGLSIGCVAVAPWLLIILGRQFRMPLGPLLGAFAGPLLATVAMSTAVLVVRTATATAPPLVQFVAAVATGVLVYGVAAAVLFRRLFLADLTAMRGVRPAAAAGSVGAD